MGFIIEGILEFIIELFVTNRLENSGSFRKRRYRSKLKRYARESEWFEGLYRNPEYTHMIEDDYELGRLLRKRSTFRAIERTLEERRRFERMLSDKHEVLAGRS
ncbi:hypothetical protein [Paenibacillus harenae]|uniref:Uncharacterized protein n=1 Tax=Paenibacillus harenae TaxID=306543 RepID=A0ABT9UE62_PAEHA|nr:hypothetical protein [Paenibacillus harenae]MDQ0116714.1 hypothetical protein [Paenibacillus harenae]